jgi:hypothetical protein
MRPMRESNLIDITTCHCRCWRGVRMQERGGFTMPNTYKVNSLSSRTRSRTQPTACNYSEHAKSPVVDKRPMMEVMENARGRMNIGKSPGTVIITSRAYGSPADMQTEFITITITSSISNMSCTGSKKKICHLQTWRSNTKVM